MPGPKARNDFELETAFSARFVPLFNVDNFGAGGAAGGEVVEVVDVDAEVLEEVDVSLGDIVRPGGRVFREWDDFCHAGGFPY